MDEWEGGGWVGVGGGKGGGRGLHGDLLWWEGEGDEHARRLCVSGIDDGAWLHVVIVRREGGWIDR